MGDEDGVLPRGIELSIGFEADRDISQRRAANCFQFGQFETALDGR